MILVEKILGSINDPLWRDRAGRARIDPLALEQWEAPKNRLRKLSEGGLELAISLDRSEHLHDGDVLHYDEAGAVIVVARVALKDVLVIELQELEKLSKLEILQACFELGHGLGNQHWPAVIKGTTIYVPLSVDQKVMASVMRTHAFRHVTTRFAPGAEIAALLDAREARLLFAGADATPHSHHDLKGHAHSHSDEDGTTRSDHHHHDGTDHDHDRRHGRP